MGSYQNSFFCASKILLTLVTSLSVVSSSRSVRAQEWERFFARVNNAKVGVNWDGSVRVETGADGLWLKSDGRYADTATGIGTAASFDDFCYEYAKRCGQYQFVNGQYILQRNSTSEPEIYSYSRISQTEDRLVRENVTYNSVPPVNNYRLSGNYRALMSRVYGFIYSFDTAGRFAVKNPKSTTAEVRTGTYTIDGYTLVLNYSDGETDVRSFYILDNVPFIDGDWYERLN